MRFIPREGVVLTKICDIYLLIPNRTASEFCPRIGNPGIFEILCWESITKGKTLDEIYEIVSKAFKAPPERSELLVKKSIDKLIEGGFLIKVDDKV